MDWGTSNLRIRLVNTADRKVLEELRFPEGVKALYHKWTDSGQAREDYYLGYLKGCLAQFQSNIDSTIPVVISGMASSSIGLRELSYSSVPFGIQGEGLKVEQIYNQYFVHPVFLISGVQTANDVMRGEEVQIVGFANIERERKQTTLFILPGTHSKHISMKQGEVVDVKTFMTGEVFDAMLNHTILGSSVKTGFMGDAETLAFLNGVQKARSGESVLHSLFQVRTNQLFNKYSPVENYYFLSGLLIGEELYHLPLEKQLNVKLCAGGALSDLYLLALEELGVKEHLEILSKESVEQAAVEGQWLIINNLNQ